jgi:hypothetical protein
MTEIGLLADNAPNVTNSEWWTCEGTLCGGGEGGGGGGGGGSGGGGSGSGSGGRGTTTEKETTLFIECNVPEATVWDKATGEKLGEVNATIPMKQGDYTIQVKAPGYKTRETAVTIGNYAVARTINLTAIGPSITQFIRGIGGLTNLTKQKYLYLFCIYKMRETSVYDWKKFADTVDIVPAEALPSVIRANDVLYIYYLVTGNPEAAKAMVDTGEVTLLDANGSETKDLETAIKIGMM